MKHTPIKPGDMVAIKTTGDPALILAINKPEISSIDERHQLSGTEVLVRRPAESHDEGLRYLTETFFIEELETSQERQLRLRGEFEQLVAGSDPEDNPLDFAPQTVN
jgi:hypothetical protein